MNKKNLVLHECSTDPPAVVSIMINRSESRLGNLKKLELKYFEIQLFHVTGNVHLVPKNYGCLLLLPKKNNRS